MGQPDVAAIAARAHEAGRLGLDTEFMPEGRYRPLLCLVQVVVESDVWVLDPTESPVLTLITCYPFTYVGTAPDRFVVLATLDERRQRAAR